MPASDAKQSKPSEHPKRSQCIAFIDNVTSLSLSLPLTMSADTSDDFFLNFGSSTNVNDELRHSLRQEVSDIDVTISKIEEESGKETRASQELRKGLSHADKEMFNLSRGSRDLVDSSNMNDTLRRRMNDDLQADLVSVYLLKGKNKTNRDENI